MNVLPSKTIHADFSLLGIGAVLLVNLGSIDTVSSAWERVKTTKQINTYEKYVAGLSLLFMLGAIEYNDGVIRKK